MEKWLRGYLSRSHRAGRNTFGRNGKKQFVKVHLNVDWKGVEIHLADEGDLARHRIHHLVVPVHPHTWGIRIIRIGAVFTLPRHSMLTRVAEAPKKGC